MTFFSEGALNVSQRLVWALTKFIKHRIFSIIRSEVRRVYDELAWRVYARPGLRTSVSSTYLQRACSARLCRARLTLREMKSHRLDRPLLVVF
jgi:hypothetical protein